MLSFTEGYVPGGQKAQAIFRVSTGYVKQTAFSIALSRVSVFLFLACCNGFLDTKTAASKLAGALPVQQERMTK